ncbi:MAG: HD domain-containing protein [Rectinemataceae bacterium]
MRMPNPPEELRELARRFESQGHKAYLVGGAVRDAFMGRPAGDYDVATDASPEEVLRIFPRVIPTGIKHGTVTVLLRHYKVEVTTFRIEHGYSDGRRPDSVEFAADIGADLSRRDFTINAMAWDILGRELVDPYGGQADLAAKIIRAVGNPEARFGEDGLRPLRALRFASQLNFSLDPDTFAAIPKALDRYRSVSAERVRDEFSKILLSPLPSRGLRLMESTGILFESLPEFRVCRGAAQKGGHAFDVLDHLYASVDAAPPDLVLRLSALFHDVGKPASRKEGEDGVPTFHRHEEISAALAEAALKRLRFPNDVVGRTAHLVRMHMFNYEDRWTDAAVRRFIAKAGAANIDDLLALRLADSAGAAGVAPDPRVLAGFRARIDAVLAAGNALSLRDLAIGGDDLAALGVSKGPAMGQILKELLETVLDDPEQNEKERLLTIAQGLNERRKPL